MKRPTGPSGSVAIQSQPLPPTRRAIKRMPGIFAGNAQLLRDSLKTIRGTIAIIGIVLCGLTPFLGQSTGGPRPSPPERSALCRK